MILYRTHTCSIILTLKILSILKPRRGFCKTPLSRLVRLNIFHVRSPCVAIFYCSAKLKLYLESPLNGLSTHTGHFYPPPKFKWFLGFFKLRPQNFKNLTPNKNLKSDRLQILSTLAQTCFLCCLKISTRLNFRNP